jgi:hypothetical protein
MQWYVRTFHHCVLYGFSLLLFLIDPVNELGKFVQKSPGNLPSSFLSLG